MIRLQSSLCANYFSILVLFVLIGQARNVMSIVLKLWLWFFIICVRSLHVWRQISGVGYEDSIRTNCWKLCMDRVDIFIEERI